MTAGIAIEWSPREPPLQPVAVMAAGRAAAALARRLLTCSADDLASLQGVVSASAVVILGEEEALPWVDGALYLGRDPVAPRLLLPTTSMPSVPVAWLERSLLARIEAQDAPWALAPTLALLVSAAAALPLDRSRIEEWLAGAAT